MTVPDSLLALSVRQPWLDMIMRGVKTVEVRSWEVQHRGPIALHGPMRIDFAAAYFFGYQEPWRLPRGGIVGIAAIVDVKPIEQEAWGDMLVMHRQPIPMMGGAYGVFLSDIQLLKRPVPCRGRQMLFPLDQGVIDRVRGNLTGSQP